MQQTITDMVLGYSHRLDQLDGAAYLASFHMVQMEQSTILEDISDNMELSDEHLK
jgi:hypothetical protein